MRDSLYARSTKPVFKSPRLRRGGSDKPPPYSIYYITYTIHYITSTIYYMYTKIYL